MNYCAIRFKDDFSLTHYGIKGQKWGVRRFQNPDGSLTSAGKKRYYTSTTDETHDKGDDRWKAYAATGAAFAAGLAINALTISAGYIDLRAAAMTFMMGAGLLTMAAKDITTAVKVGANKLKTKNNPVDEKTGLKLKTKETSKKEDLKKVNPEYSNTASNTKSNCMLCTTAYDMRRRGFEVQANKASYGYDNEDINRWYPKAKVKTVKADTRDEAVNKLVDELSKQKNSRGNFMVYWDYSKTQAYGGHSMVYEVNDGKVSILDAQNGKVYTRDLAYNKTIDVISKAMPEYDYARLDNVDYDPEKIKEAVRS